MDYTPEPQDTNHDSTAENQYDAQPIPLAQPRLTARRHLRREIYEIVVMIVTIYTLVNLATARAVVEGPSMQPNFYTGQLVVVNRAAYYFAVPQRGDVVILHSPSQNCAGMYETSGCEDLIKRVIALPGETVELKEGRIYINGVLIDEPYIAQFCLTCPNDHWTLKTNEYFVLGDNRQHSYDSHSFGPINRHLIVGQAWIRYWPIQDMGFIQHPRYAELPTPIQASH